MTKKTAREKARDLIEEETIDTWDDDTLHRLMNTAIKMVASIFRSLDEGFYQKTDKFTLQDNVELYDLPSDFLKLKLVSNPNSDNTPLTKVSPQERSDYLNIGVVRVYYFEDKKIGFLDIPLGLADYEFPNKYIRTPTLVAEDYSDDATALDIPDELGCELVAHLIAMYALNIEEEDEMWLPIQARALKDEIVENFTERNSDFARVVGRDSSFELDD